METKYYEINDENGEIRFTINGDEGHDYETAVAIAEAMVGKFERTFYVKELAGHKTENLVVNDVKYIVDYYPELATPVKVAKVEYRK